MQATSSSGKSEASKVKRLSSEDWLKAAERAITKGGMREAKILPLSKSLGVTRGSFYWHFTDHQDFIEQFIQRWEQRQRDLLHLWLEDDEDPIQAISKTLDLVLSSFVLARRIVRLELAIRSQATTDTLFSQAVRRVDELRCDHFLPYIRKIISDEQQARAFAYGVYVQVIGAQIVLNSTEEPQELKDKIKQSILQTFQLFKNSNAASLNALSSH